MWQLNCIVLVTSDLVRLLCKKGIKWCLNTWNMHKIRSSQVELYSIPTGTFDWAHMTHKPDLRYGHMLWCMKTWVSRGYAVQMVRDRELGYVQASPMLIHAVQMLVQGHLNDLLFKTMKSYAKIMIFKQTRAFMQNCHCDRCFKCWNMLS